MSSSRGQDLARRVRLRVARLIAPPSPVEEPLEGGTPHYYAQQPTCQIGDMWFLLEFFLGQREEGVFVEVGAFDGVTFSNTWGLAERKWTGLLIEPIPAFAAKARAGHAAHPAVKVVQSAVGSREGSLTLMVAGALTSGNSDLNNQYAQVEWAKASLGTEQVVVPITTLSKLLDDELHTEDVDVLVVDVEGFEREVFEGFDWRVQPRMMVIELADVHPDLTVTRTSDARLMQEIVDRGYRVAFKDQVNTVFVRKDIWESALQIA